MRSTRLAQISTVLCSTALAMGVVAAGVVGKAPATAHPKAVLTSVKTSGKHLSFRVTVSFQVPARDHPASACRGSVTLSEKVRPAGAAPHWAAKLAPKGHRCVAHVKGQLPLSLLDRRVPFKLSFPGNGTIAPFASSKKLKLSGPAGSQPGGNAGPGVPGAGSGTPPAASEPPTIPVAPYTAADGHWEGAAPEGNIHFEVVDGVIRQLSTYSSVLLQCEKKDGVPQGSLRYALFRYKHDIPLGHVGEFHDSYTDVFSDPSSDGQIPWVVYGNLGASSGTVVLEANDAYFNVHFPEEPEYTVSDCHLSITFEAGKK